MCCVLYLYVDSDIYFFVHLNAYLFGNDSVHKKKGNGAHREQINRKEKKRKRNMVDEIHLFVSIYFVFSFFFLVKLTRSSKYDQNYGLNIEFNEPIIHRWYIYNLHRKTRSFKSCHRSASKSKLRLSFSVENSKMLTMTFGSKFFFSFLNK